VRIVDADSHFWEPQGWLAETDPDLDRELAETLPPQNAGEVIFGEVIAELPPEQREGFLASLPGRMQDALRRVMGDGAEPAEERQRRFEQSPMGRRVSPEGAWRVDERLAFCDERGIDVQLVSPTTTLALHQHTRRHAPHLLERLCQAYNTWALEHVCGHEERLVPVTLTSFSDPDWAVRELVRVRRRGSRAFLLPLYPVDGRALSHVDHEPVWAAAADLGMIPVLHVANGSVVFDPAWTNTGRPDAGRSAFRLASSLNAQIPQVPLGDLVLNGVFERHPRLRVLCSEFGLSWVPGWLDKLGPTSRDGTPNIGALMGWPLSRSAVDTVREHVLFSPLRGQRADELLAGLGAQSVVFATDFPHPEGSPDAVSLFDEQLAGVEAATRSAFFGATLSRVLEAGR